eukprot:765463-Hanusia_phi.AAC.4
MVSTCREILDRDQGVIPLDELLVSPSLLVLAKSLLFRAPYMSQPDPEVFRYRSVEQVKAWEELMCTFFEDGSWTKLEELYALTE